MKESARRAQSSSLEIAELQPFLYKESGGANFHRSAYAMFLYGCLHSLLNEPCVAVHQVDDVGMVLCVLVLKSVALYVPQMQPSNKGAL